MSDSFCIVGRFVVVPFRSVEAMESMIHSFRDSRDDGEYS